MMGLIVALVFFGGVEFVLATKSETWNVTFACAFGSVGCFTAAVVLFLRFG